MQAYYRSGTNFTETQFQATVKSAKFVPDFLLSIIDKGCLSITDEQPLESGNKKDIIIIRVFLRLMPCTIELD